MVDAVARELETFGGLDTLVNHASAISLTGTLDTPMRRYDLMQNVNARATFLCAQAGLPHLLRSSNPHILTMSPPLNLSPRWLGPHFAYTMSKYGMSLCTLGLAAKFGDRGVARSGRPAPALETGADGGLRLFAAILLYSNFE